MGTEIVKFVNLEGKTKQFRRQLSEIHFDIKPESVGRYFQFYDKLNHTRSLIGSFV